LTVAHCGGDFVISMALRSGAVAQLVVSNMIVQIKRRRSGSIRSLPDVSGDGNEAAIGNLIVISLFNHRKVGHKRHARPAPAALKIRPGKLLLLSHKGYFGNSGVLNGRHYFSNLCINNVLIGI